MDFIKCFLSMREEKNLLKYDSNYFKMYFNLDVIIFFIEKIIYLGEDSMDIIKSYTVVIDN